MTKRFDFDAFDQSIRDAIIDDALAAGPVRPMWTNEGFGTVDNDGVPVGGVEEPRMAAFTAALGFSDEFIAWLYSAGEEE